MYARTDRHYVKKFEHDTNVEVQLLVDTSASMDAGAFGTRLGFDAWFSELFASLGAPDHFASFGEGVLRLGDILFFVGGTAVALYLCTILISRRHW